MNVRKRRWWPGLLLIPALMVAIPVALATHNRFPSPEDVVEPVPLGPEVGVDNGTFAGVSWALTAFVSDRGLCVSMDFFPTMNAAGGGCGFGLEGELGTATGADAKLGYVSDCLEQQGVSFVYGPVTKDVSNVLIFVSNASPVKVLPIKGGPDDGSMPYDFYVSPMQGCPIVSSVVAQESNGQPLGTIILEPRPSG